MMTSPTCSKTTRLVLVRKTTEAGAEASGDSAVEVPSGERLVFRGSRQTVRFDLDAAAVAASIRLARDAAIDPDADGETNASDFALAALPDLARERREAMGAARRLLNARLSASETCLEAALDRMIDGVIEENRRERRAR